MMKLINTLSGGEFVGIGLLFLVLVYFMFRIYKQIKFDIKIKFLSHDIITYSVKPRIGLLMGPTIRQGKHQAIPFYSWTLEFTDQWGDIRTKVFNFLEEILPQEVTDNINQLDGLDSSKNLPPNKLGFELDYSKIKGEKNEIVKQRLLGVIGDTIEIKQDSIDHDMFILENPLKKFNGQDNNDAEEERSFLPWRIGTIFIIICFGLVLVYLNYS